MTLKTKRKEKIDFTILLLFKALFLILNKIGYIIKNPILLFFIFRKFKKDLHIKQKSVKLLFFLNQTFFFYKYEKFYFIFFIKLFINLNFLISYVNKISKKNFPMSNLIFVKKVLSLFDYNLIKLNQGSVIKKESLNIKFKKINFLLLFDQFKKRFKSRQVLLDIFRYYEINKRYLNNTTVFRIIGFIHLNVSLKYFDKFVFYLLKQINRIFYNKPVFTAYNCLQFSKINKKFYLRYKNNFFIHLFTKILYKQQFCQELLYFLKRKLKTNLNSLTFLNIKKRTLYFLGFYLTFKKKCKSFILKANLVKIIIRFFCLGYINKLNKPISSFIEYFALTQVISLIKLKLILQSLNSYYKRVKNKKYIIFKIVLMLKVTILKVFASKFNYKSRAQILQFYKKDLSRFIS